jgi:hypothetical protein
MHTEPSTPKVIACPVVVFGRDDQGKPHASRFGAADAELAEKAAGLMGMRVLRVASDEHEAIAAKLPQGRVFASGRGFVPFVKPELFAKLAAAPDAFVPDRPTDAPVKALGRPKGGRSASPGGEPAGGPSAAAERPGTPPADWDQIKVGSLVLAAEEGKPAIWYVATIVTDRGEDLFELRWLDDGDGELPLIVRRREHLGLFPPAVAGALG